MKLKNWHILIKACAKKFYSKFSGGRKRSGVVGTVRLIIIKYVMTNVVQMAISYTHAPRS